jgi:hypothetical protein
MSLENFAHYNDLSPKLRLELEKKVESFGRVVRYKFDIVRPNPDPSRYNGDTIYPNIYTLDPTRFTIQDSYEDRDDKTKTKTIALIDENAINENGLPEKFIKVRVNGAAKAILTLNIEENREDFYIAMFLELHPKNKGGKFAGKNVHHIFSRIDENAAAREARTGRSERLKALNAAQSMSDMELVNFADAMQWDSSENYEVLRNKVEELADTNPIYFNDLVSSKAVEYQSLIKQAMNKDLISFNYGEYKFVWSGNQQTITTLSPTGTQTEIQKLSEWMQTSGNKGDDLYKKLKSLVKGEKIEDEALVEKAKPSKKEKVAE